MTPEALPFLVPDAPRPPDTLVALASCLLHPDQAVRNQGEEFLGVFFPVTDHATYQRAQILRKVVDNFVWRGKHLRRGQAWVLEVAAREFSAPAQRPVRDMALTCAMCLRRNKAVHSPDWAYLRREFMPIGCALPITYKDTEAWAPALAWGIAKHMGVP